LWCEAIEMKLKSDLEQHLVRRNIKPTAMRMIVLDYFRKHEHALSLRDLETGLENTDRVTLFRTLKTFVDHKIVHTVNDGKGSVKYAICGDTCECDYPQDIHVHFHCKLCGETRCLPAVKVPAIHLPGNYSAEEASVVVNGVCAGCTA
jgi:Fur family transcriptional regulator, ferric uptake regulator